ncbi:hypothetical protein QCA50_015525 [Cerrena zonata]|uniref:CxC2-like cysteine cluster KDZ transposase-associated domain-containing protein n=1 Tax=Cerrena zonata TaxID=2478898 RepID=A0AAW0FK02_9APHY
MDVDPALPGMGHPDDPMGDYPASPPDRHPLSPGSDQPGDPDHPSDPVSTCPVSPGTVYPNEPAEQQASGSTHRETLYPNPVSTCTPDDEVVYHSIDPFLDITSDEEDDWRDPTTGGIPLRGKKPNRGYDMHQCPLITAVHASGIHELRVRPCRCALGRHIPVFDQMLYMGLYPASRKQTRTVFTFEALDDYDLENLETKASAAKHYDKLIRLTANAFPSMVPKRYRELLRIAREWRNLKSRQRAGYAYSPADVIPAGGLALFCPTCPQPGVNLPEDWRDDPDKKKYMRTLLADGNFKQDHLVMKYDEDDVPLSDGHGYMVTKAPFDTYLSATSDPVTVEPSCHEHRAVSQQNQSHAHLDVTGIGAIACGRHGCFYPHAVVNFRKGEGQRYMDYAFVQAILYVRDLLVVLLLYDIMCQFWVNFLKRMRAMPDDLQLPGGVEFKRGIGLFHVHGHVKECFARYAPTFIQGAGMLDGEIIETLWNLLNYTASSARAMSWFHRQEYIDTHMGDSNWKKLIGMVAAIFQKWKNAVDQAAESDQDFQSLCASVGKEKFDKWSAEEADAQNRRNEDPTAMDIFDIKEEEAPGKTVMANIWIYRELEPNTATTRGSTSWITMGIRITEQQIELRKEVRKAGKFPTPDQTKKILEKRQSLQQQIDTFKAQSRAFCSLTNEPDPDPSASTLPDDWEDDPDQPSGTDGTHEEEEILEESSDGREAERVAVPLPSSFGKVACKTRLQSLAAIELDLRIGQANDALRFLRIAIGQKSFNFRTKFRVGSGNSGYKNRLRNYAENHTLQMTIDQAAQVYLSSRRAMETLGASQEILSKFKILTKAHISSSTAVVDPNARGERNNGLSWIWHTQHDPAKDPAWLDELYRVNWLRAKSRRDRWAEELALTRAEMDWTKLFHQHRRDQWLSRANEAKANYPKLQYYAHKQAKTWDLLVSQVDNALSRMN